ncbi:hypothetical protein IQ16_07200 [Bradyrhizobium huanghuaihaiense]|uniref:Uncharacterized protein n=1 Tax=Bradyrhizobium huanghuaihaiense TaxID=990078 RepID=A0A562QX14_9BRAD|nr:hypothetical protein IQ16_07200 [Bradyrhizobium huanghuaihaiense]
MRQCGQVNITSGLATGALYFKPRVTAVDCLIDRGRRIDWLAIPHAFVPALAQEAIGPFDQLLAFGASRCGLRCQDGGHRACLAELLVQRLSIATGERRRVMLRSHPGRGLSIQTGSKVGQQPSSSYLPVRLWQVLFNRRCPTSFQMACRPYRRTASAFWISTIRSHLRQETRRTCCGSSDRRSPVLRPTCSASAGRPSRMECQYSSGMSSCGPSGLSCPTGLPIDLASFSICFGVGNRQLAGRPLMVEN